MRGKNPVSEFKNVTKKSGTGNFRSGEIISENKKYFYMKIIKFIVSVHIFPFKLTPH